MATYVIVSSSKTPLDPGEVHAGTPLTVADGDVVIIESGADMNVTFATAGGGPVDFDVQIADGNVNALKLTMSSGLNPTIDIADDVDISGIDIDAAAADSLTLVAGNGVTLGKLDGSAFADNITLGDDFTATGDWNLLGGNDTLVAGENADFTASKLKAGTGNDSVTFGDGATFGEVDGGQGNDTLSFGDNISGAKIVSGDGNDSVSTGSSASISDKVDGGGGNDTLTTQTGGLNATGFETTNVICFAAGTLIVTDRGEVPVERIMPGDRILTMDKGPMPLRWVGRFDVDAATLDRAPRLRPIRIAAGALGPGIPARDLMVSRLHRVLVHSKIVERIFGTPGILVPAKVLVGLDGIERVETCAPVGYLHLLLDGHQILCANGAAMESIYLGAQTLATMADRDKQAIKRATGRAVATGPAARQLVTDAKDLDGLFARHRKNGKPLQTPDLVRFTGQTCRIRRDPVGGPVRLPGVTPAAVPRTG